MTDKPIHLADFAITQKEPNSEPSVTVPVWITQSSLDGLFELMRFLDGLSRGSDGIIPGSFELTMFYRTLFAAIRNAESLPKNLEDDALVQTVVDAMQLGASLSSGTISGLARQIHKFEWRLMARQVLEALERAKLAGEQG